MKRTPSKWEGLQLHRSPSHGQVSPGTGASAKAREPRMLLMGCLLLALVLAAPSLMLGLWGNSASFMGLSIFRNTLGISPYSNRWTTTSTWESLALTRVLLSGRVTQAMDLEDQLLLVVTIPCNVELLLERLHATAPPPSAADVAAMLPWRCAVGAGTPQEELTMLRGVAARGQLMFVRCPLPDNRHVGRNITVAVKQEHVNADWGEEWARADVGQEADGTRAHRKLSGPADPVDQAAPVCLPPLQDAAPGAGANRTAGSVLPILLESAATIGGAEDVAYSGRRMVLESLPQHEGIYLFVEGLSWRKDGQDVSIANMTCIYGSSWRAPAVVGVPGDMRVMACPYPPEGEVQRMVEAEGKGGVGLVPITVEDGEGVLPSVAFFRPGLPAPPQWRVPDPSVFCRKDKKPESKKAQETQGQVPEKKKFTLCSCTMLSNDSRFLQEWVMYHAWMGVEHFFIYDNNSDDDLYATALRLSTSIPHPSAFRPPGVDNYTTPGAGEEGEGRTGQKARETVGFSVFPWPWLKTQQAGFSHCILQAGPLCDWVTFTDRDEYIFPKFVSELKSRTDLYQAREQKGPFIPYLLSTSQQQECPKPVGHWASDSLEFGPSGQLQHPPDGVTRGYICRRKSHGQTKVILRPSASRMELTHWVHVFGIRDPYTASGRGQQAILFHYKFQAWPEYRRKFIRRVAASVGDWVKVTKPDTVRGDGVVIDKTGVPHPPEDWAGRWCEVETRDLAETMWHLFSEDVGGGKARLPWAK